MKILYIDDKPEMRQILQRHLETWGYDAIGADNGENGWELILSEHPDIVITDWMMPGMDGLELIRKIRSASFSGYIYIILLTGRTIKEDLITGIDAGADDFVCKPYDKQEFKARINAAARIITLERAMEVKNRELEENNSKLKEAYEVIREDLEAAARIQRSLIPQKITGFRGISCDWLFVPSQFIAGDIFNILQIDENHLVYYLLDVSGHGIPAALLSTTLSNLLKPTPNFSSPIRRPSTEPPYYQITPPREVASELNGRFMNDGLQLQYFTMIYGVVNIETWDVVLTQAGHPSPIFQAADGTVELIGDGGFPVGMVPDVGYDEHTFSLKPGERLFLYSDGIIECRRGNDEMFGIERLLEIIKDSRRQPLRTVMEMIERELAVFRGDWKFDDDISLLVLEKTEET